jgi:hypothetical protein
MGAHGDGSMERNRQPSVVDNGVPASRLVSPGLRRGAQCRVFTPNAINTIRELAGQGKSALEIAEVIGSTIGSVRVNCSHLKIKIKPKRKGQQGHIRQIAGQKLIISLSDPVYAALERKAADMHRSVVELSRELLEAIIGGDIYEAVLDDGNLK